MTNFSVPVEPTDEQWLSAATAFEDAVPSYLRGHQEWIERMQAAIKALSAAPAAQETATHWAIIFDDYDRRPEIFTDESAARHRYKEISYSWNAHLFVKIDSNSRDAAQETASSGTSAEIRNAVDVLQALVRKETAILNSAPAAQETERPKIVCLCGSTRFVAEMACIAWALERDIGCITLGLHLLPVDYPNIQPDHMAEHEGVKEHMDNLHKRKIDLADEVLVVNIGGYIGESTRSEIEYAEAKGKPVKYMETPQ